MSNKNDQNEINESTTRRGFLQASGLGIASLAVGSSLSGPARAVGSLSPGSSGKRSESVLKIQRTQLNPDGARTITGITANGRYPGPLLRLKEGDLFRARLENHLSDQKTSIHWHGLLVPATMDGVPNVSHIPVNADEVFVYEFPVLQSGTYWYHSHFGLQEQIGLGGPMIIEPAEEPLEYDSEQIIFLSDWLHRDPYKVFDELKQRKPAMPAKGSKADLSDIEYDSFLLNGKGPGAPWTVAARPGERIRFRIINGGASTYFRFGIDEHPLTVVHADGQMIEPIEVDNMLIGMAETYDVIVTVGGTGSFTIRAESQDGSGQAIGVLHTKGVKPVPDMKKPNWGSRKLNYRQLRSAEPLKWAEKVDNNFNLNLTGKMKGYIWSINDQVWPEAEPLIVHQDELVQFTMKNTTGMWHPMHLHGHFFKLIIPETNPKFCPLKHTVSVAPGQTIRIQFKADNPGRWFFHCHNLYHLDAGMAREIIYKV